MSYGLVVRGNMSEKDRQGPGFHCRDEEIFECFIEIINTRRSLLMFIVLRIAERSDKEKVGIWFFAEGHLTLSRSSSSSASEGPRSSIFWLRRPSSRWIISLFSTSWPLRYFVRSSHAASQLLNLRKSITNKT